MPTYNYWCLNKECGNNDLTRIDVPDDCKDNVTCFNCGKTMKRVGTPSCSVIPDYSDISNFGKPQYADARRKVCGLESGVPPDNFHPDDIQ